MENLQRLVVDGRMKLPVGYRFCPTDEELLVHYLRRKIFGQPMPVSIISETGVFLTEPWGLPGVGNSKEKKFFFSNSKDCVLGNMTKRAAGSGFWKSIGKDKPIVAPVNNRLIGLRKRLVFCEGKRVPETRTRWVMHELRLVRSGTASNPVQTLGDWAVYRIFQKKRKQPKTKGSNGAPSNCGKAQRLEEIKPSFIDFTVECDSDISPPPPCSPSCSEGDEIASNKLD